MRRSSQSRNICATAHSMTASVPSWSILETIRRVEAFADAAREAQKRGKPVIVLKLGASEGGRAMVQAHTGSLAGEDRLYDALFRKLDIVRVRDIDEMLEAAIMLSAYPKPREGNLVAVTLSGGEAALIADTAFLLGVTLQKLAAPTLERLRPAFPPYSKIGNPVDAWGLGFNAERFGMIVDALVADPDIGTIAFSVDAPGAGGADVPYACVMAETLSRQPRAATSILSSSTIPAAPDQIRRCAPFSIARASPISPACGRR